MLPHRHASKLFLIISLLLTLWGCLKSTDPGLPKEVQIAIHSAHHNSPELMKAILHFQSKKDSSQLQSLYYLIANLPQQYTTYSSLIDAANNKITINPFEFPSDVAIKQYLDNLSKTRGSIAYHIDSFGIDLSEITAKQLITNVENAHQQWKNNAWSQQYSATAFKNYILPYRVANEPIVPFRKHLAEKYQTQLLTTKNLSDAIQTIDSLINEELICDTRFTRLPQPQDIIELEQTKRGNHFEIALYKVYALRSVGIAAGLDYCPYYADSVNGIWTASAFLHNGDFVVLSPKGIDTPYPSNSTAKIYRRSFVSIKTSLYSTKQKSIHSPPYLGHYDYKDVTNQYFPTVNKEFIIDTTNNTYFYLAVYNDKKWKAIDWDKKDSTGLITFNNLNPKIRYRLAIIKDKIVSPFGDSFMITSD